MINVSSEFLQKVQTRTDFSQHADITFADGRTLNLVGDDFTFNNNSITDGAGESSVPLGFAVEKTVKLELTNYEDEYYGYDFFGARIHLYLIYQLDPEDPDRLETVNYGYYTVISPESYGETVIVTAVDDMYKADKPFSLGSFPPTPAGALLANICQTCGINLGSGSFYNDDFIFSPLPEGEKYSFRQVIGYIAMAACGNARIGYDGSLYIQSYSITDEPLHTLTKWIGRPRIQTSDIVITGIRTEIETEDASGNKVTRVLLEGTDNYALTIENPFCTTAAIAQSMISNIASRLVGKTFRAFDGEYIGYPIAEFMDPIDFVDGKGVTHRSFLTDITFTFRGRTEFHCAADEPLRNSLNYASGSSTYIRARKLVEAERSAREKALEILSQRIADSGGLYTTAETQQDGSTIYYLHNQPDLSDSTYIWKMTAKAWAVSSDGGETWNAGIEVNGNVIANILRANGINADWINAGTFSITDSNGTVIFQASKDNHSVYISGDNVQIGGEPLPDALNNTTSFYVSLSNEHQAISTDSSGSYGTFPTCQTKATVFYGSRDVSASCTYSASASTGVTGSWNNSTRIYTVTGLSTDSGYVDITATYNGASTTKRFTISKIRDGNSGEDAVLLIIDSSNGNMFKNSEVSTVLSVTIFKAGVQIETLAALKTAFGNAAKIIWKYKGLGEDTWHTVLSTDSRLSDGGMRFQLSPADVDTKITFTCELDY